MPVGDLRGQPLITEAWCLLAARTTVLVNAIHTMPSAACCSCCAKAQQPTIPCCTHLVAHVVPQQLPPQLRCCSPHDCRDCDSTAQLDG